MNILTIPYITGGDSHFIPLFVLHQRYIRKDRKICNFFLINDKKKLEIGNFGVKVVNQDYSIELNGNNIISQEIIKGIVKKEKLAFKEVNPSIIVEDCCFSSPLIAEKKGIPRISIHRTGFFRSVQNTEKHVNHIHSIEKDQFNNDKSTKLISFFSRNKINDPVDDMDYLKNYLHCKAKIIPGIKSIEVLPADIQDRDSYFFCGPLTVEDNPSKKMLEDLHVFFETNKGNKVVFITTGLIDNTSINEFIDILFDKSYAIISTVDIIVNDNNKYKFLYSRVLPLNYVCSKVDLVIHHCGSGIYHYPIMNDVASITIGTRCYDREDVAVRLESLKVSRHVPHKLDNPKYIDVFKDCLNLFEQKRLCDYSTLKKLKKEIYETMLSFDIGEVIKYALIN
ncbi:hypothetical protein LNP80_02495 [Chryseobacterium sp. C-39]|uniref:Uncharacterized protein n=1 Tax=Chryseobacterium muglaense TaxID=2893752 RepID=A0A9Q3YPQ3_9FLAO|nr:hypothetical protein [Chryseobacterium muglaense]MBD3907111.1 hypothetical protein [Chryseobacterium muglaense]MCC9033126.1 hypothetical protein [Chryseobacterium muglaense]